MAPYLCGICRKEYGNPDPIAKGALIRYVKEGIAYYGIVKDHSVRKRTTTEDPKNISPHKLLYTINIKAKEVASVDDHITHWPGWSSEEEVPEEECIELSKKKSKLT